MTIGLEPGAEAPCRPTLSLDHRDLARGNPPAYVSTGRRDGFTPFAAWLPGQVRCCNASRSSIHTC
jgi:hypothetical protein